MILTQIPHPILPPLLRYPRIVGQRLIPAVAAMLQTGPDTSPLPRATRTLRTNSNFAVAVRY